MAHVAVTLRIKERAYFKSSDKTHRTDGKASESENPGSVRQPKPITVQGLWSAQGQPGHQSQRKQSQ